MLDTVLYGSPHESNSVERYYGNIVRKVLANNGVIVLVVGKQANQRPRRQERNGPQEIATHIRC